MSKSARLEGAEFMLRSIRLRVRNALLQYFIGATADKSDYTFLVIFDAFN